ncbi:hypothetical protein B1812_08405 [Methylocystis bryophila]|uniref:Glycosyltransferase 2-like domain-containing protein n=2 Tax=Methylocystis bryophila TaxID=655015 RepID=A0A1W6MU00_9HYPH|nr:hypothetical protein B1812_08405 [Methylocystis bryophila]
MVRASGLFDETAYAAKYQVWGGAAAIEHYLSVGWKLGFDPSERFSTTAYLRLNPDVAAADINPLEHFLRHGRVEGRRIWDDGKPATAGLPAAAAQTASSPTPVISLEAEAGNLADVPITPDLRRMISSPYYLSHYQDVALSGVDPLDHYLSYGWREDRNPSENFDTAFYLSRHPELRAGHQAPLYHFRANGGEAGNLPTPEHRIVLDPFCGEASELRYWRDRSLKIGVHVHVFFPELIGELLIALANLPEHAKLRFTTIAEGDRRYVENFVAARKPRWDFDVVVVDRVGRDVGPLFQACADLWQTSDFMLHIHTKRSQHTHFGDAWRRYLLDQCLGMPELLDRVFGVFVEDPSVALVFPDNFFEIKKFVGLNGNEDTLSALCRALGYPNYNVRTLREFPAGSFAWFRSSAYAKLVEHLNGYDAFAPGESIEGTMAHVLERAFAAVPSAAGLKIRSFSTPRRPLLDYSSEAREFPVYLEPHTSRWLRDSPRISKNTQAPLAPRHPFYNAHSLNIHWIIPSFGVGAGGHMTIFRFVEQFERFGHRQTIWIQNPSNYRAPVDALKVIRENYRPIGDSVFVRFLPESLAQLSGDVLIATDCWTAYPVAAATKFKERFYFIQDYESLFHPAGAIQLTVERTYHFGFAALCAGPWLAKMASDHGMWSRAWYLAADEKFYFAASTPKWKRRNETTHIAFYARANTARRAVDLGLAAFEELAQMGYHFHVHFFGGEERLPAIGFEASYHGVVSPEELGDLYRRCDIGVVFSATNYSLIPLEMMACALPVVELDVDSIRAVFKDDELLMTEPTPPSVAKAIAQLIEKPEIRAALAAKGQAAAAKYKWEESARLAEVAIFECLQEKKFLPLDVAEICAPHLAKCRKASVFLPVKNGGAFFEKVVERILGQKTDFEFDFLVHDNGSTDGTVDLLKREAAKHSNFRFIEQPPHEFQHGRARNLGIRNTDGEYVAITTADALPADEFWLANLVAGFSKGPRVAGVTGRHRPHPNHGPFLERDMKNGFDNFRNLSDVYGFDVPLARHIYPGGQEWQMISLFYSDNNSCMSRAVWKVLPYPEIDWGEDMVWAWEALQLGFQKAYADDAIVYHSHEWDLRKSEEWYSIEGRFWMEHFGFDIAGDADAHLGQWNVRDRLFAIEHKVGANQLRRQLGLNVACLRGRAAGVAEAKHLEASGDEGVGRPRSPLVR